MDNPASLTLSAIAAAAAIFAAIKSSSTKTGVENTTAAQERTERLLSEELRANRQEIAAAVTSLGQGQIEQMKAIAGQVQGVGQATESRMERLRGVVDERLSELQVRNDEKLKLIRRTVDEKLHETLERRLGEGQKEGPGSR